MVIAINQGVIYALRYELCDDMMRSLDLTDRDSRRTMWNFLSPIALFASVASAKVGRNNELVPVAIQMNFSPDSKVYTPKDGDNWLIAKLNVQVTDIGYAQIVEHLAKCHYLIEPFCVSLKRTLPPMHPLNQILKYHCREVIVPNTFGTPALVHENKFMDLLFAYGNEGASRLLREAHPSSTWETTDFRGNIKKRGLADKRLLPYFPYRDDGIRILKVIERMVKTYVKLDKDVEDDVEIQAYLNEVSLSGTGENGGIGRIQGLPASINTKAELCEIVSRIISHLTVQHASVNYELSDYAEYIPNMPTKLYDDTRVEEGEFSVYRLPNRITSAIEASFSNSLATFRFDTLFDYGNELQDTKAAIIVNSYYRYLMDVVQPRMQELNQKRKDSGHLTYPYLIPQWLPNGIQT
ncbi:hypothetical protein OS493_002702 [Desmophyllum pertusum]|uniref:Lipoxygenase domain-containing protein n=1 Tax=Desmophyllum pertusum TaxID=174260 RepID=A0A9W9YW60_9CNID|nr:hypothetical protein OS493_002702 [Desmophyllum pertusum]